MNMLGAPKYTVNNFFRFTCLRNAPHVMMIGCANLRTKQGRRDDYISVTLTSSNSDWHKGWFYLWNDLEHALPAYTGCSIAKSQRNWANGPAKEQEKMLKLHWIVLGRLRNAGITLAAAPTLRHDGRHGPLGGDCDRTGASVAARGSAPCGTSDREIDLLMAAGADASNAPQLGDREIRKLSIFPTRFIRPLSWNDLLGVDLGVSLSLQLKCAHLVLTKAPLPEEAIFNLNQAATEKRHAAHKALHKK
jgi:hypothetical protein